MIPTPCKMILVELKIKFVQNKYLWQIIRLIQPCHPFNRVEAAPMTFDFSSSQVPCVALVAAGTDVGYLMLLIQTMSI